MDIKPEYLGDGVYASFDDYHIVLQTEIAAPGGGVHVNVIYLEPQVMRALRRYEDKINALLGAELHGPDRLVE